MFIHNQTNAGTRSAPREITLDNSIINPKDADSVRVSTPPRIITLSEHYYPTGPDESETGHNDELLDNNSVQSSEDLRSAGGGRGSGSGIIGLNGGSGRNGPLAVRPKKLYNPEFSFRYESIKSYIQTCTFHLTHHSCFCFIIICAAAKQHRFSDRRAWRPPRSCKICAARCTNWTDACSPLSWTMCSVSNAKRLYTALGWRTFSWRHCCGWIATRFANRDDDNKGETYTKVKKPHRYKNKPLIKNTLTQQ